MQQKVDFFVSYAGPDRPWAEWIGARLQSEGYSVVLDVWDWQPGDNMISRTNDALMAANRVIALYSRKYFDRERYTTDEWTAILAERPRPGSARRRLVPLRIEDVTPPPMLGGVLYRDLFDLDEAHAAAELLSAVAASPAGPPRTSPPYPPSLPTQMKPVRLPGTQPAIWNVPLRNRSFTGREQMIANIHASLTNGARVLVQALHGAGGVGKTQLAIEYAYMFASEYELVWWVDAERPELIAEQFWSLAITAGWATVSTPVAVGASIAVDRLRQTQTWLLVIDNAVGVDDLTAWIPGGSGNVIITSRNSAFTAVASVIEIDTFERDESIQLLLAQEPPPTREEANRLAEALGDLPLALAQASGLLATTSMTVEEYLQELASQAVAILGAGRAVHYPLTFGGATATTMDQLETMDGEAADLIRLCAWLAPEPIPLEWFRRAPDQAVSPTLAQRIARPLTFRNLLGRIADLGLGRVTHQTLQLHRLTQAVLRDQDHSPALGARHRAQSIVLGAQPGDGREPSTWQVWAGFLPHLLALDPVQGDADLRSAACDSLWYLLMHGEYLLTLDLARSWFQVWRDAYGPDERTVLAVGSHLALAHRLLGDHAQARALDSDILARRRRLLGDDHEETLVPPGAWGSTCAARARPPPRRPWTRTPSPGSSAPWAAITRIHSSPQATLPPTCACSTTTGPPQTSTSTRCPSAGACWARAIRTRCTRPATTQSISAHWGGTTRRWPWTRTPTPGAWRFSGRTTRGP